MTFEPHPREFFAPDQAPDAADLAAREAGAVRASWAWTRCWCRRFDYDFARIAAEEFVERILVRGLAVRWLLVGDDFRFGARRAGDFDLLARAGREHGFEVVRMDTCAVDGVRVSSTAVRERLAAGDLDGAARLLGRPYSISGRVVRGERLGRAARIPDRQRAAGAQPPAADGNLRGRGAGARPGARCRAWRAWACDRPSRRAGRRRWRCTCSTSTATSTAGACRCGSCASCATRRSIRTWPTLTAAIARDVRRDCTERRSSCSMQQAIVSAL